MSIDYYATLSGNKERCLAILRGEEVTTLPNRDGLRADLLAGVSGLYEEGPRELYQLMWYSDGYIQVYVNECSVSITHGTGGDGSLIDALEEIFDLLKQHGLHVYDPQNDDFLDGFGNPTPPAPPRPRKQVEWFTCSSCEDTMPEWECLQCSTMVRDKCKECHNELAHG